MGVEKGLAFEIEYVCTCTYTAPNLNNPKYFPGQVLGMFLPNCVEFPIMFSGATNAGMVVTTMNPIYTSTEISRQLAMSKASWVATNKELLPVIQDAIGKLSNSSKEDWNGKVILMENESGKLIADKF